MGVFFSLFYAGLIHVGTWPGRTLMTASLFSPPREDTRHSASFSIWPSTVLSSLMVSQGAWSPWFPLEVELSGIA